MSSSISLIAAPSSLGLSRPGGRIPRVDLLPEVLLEAGLARRLGASLETTVAPGPYEPLRDKATGVLNPHGIVDLSRRLADAVEAARRASRFPLVLGGDCSVLLGCLLGLRRTGVRPGLAYLDGHTDFWPPEASPLGGVAGMGLWFSSGRGPALLSNLEGHTPLVREEDVVLMGVRDPDDWGEGSSTEHARDTAMTQLDLEALRAKGIAASARLALDRLNHPGTAGFWVHLDVDVLDDAVMPAVDSRQPDGLRPEELSGLLARLAGSGHMLGMNVTIYDPSLDPERHAARVLVDVLSEGLSAIA